MDEELKLEIQQYVKRSEEAIDTVKGREPGIVDSPGFEDIDIRLPEKSNLAVYVSPAGYLSFIMGMMSQMGQGMPVGAMGETMKPDIGFAVATNLDRDGVRNFTYFLVEEIQELVSTVLNLGQMMKTQK